MINTPLSNHHDQVGSECPVGATKYGAVVKLEFTPVCHTGGRGFESRQLRHFNLDGLE